jgi:hypothetical protein
MTVDVLPVPGKRNRAGLIDSRFIANILENFLTIPIHISLNFI